MKRKKNRDSEENWSHKNDFPIEEVWNTDNTIAQLIVPRLQAFKALDKHGVREWNKTKKKMIDAFELMKYVSGVNTKEEERIVEEGFDLFRKYFRSLWD